MIPARDGDHATPRTRGRVPWATGLSCAVASGVLSFLGFAGFDLWPLSFIALVPLLIALDAEAMRGPAALALGWLCGAIAQAGGTYWLVGTLTRFSGHGLIVSAALAFGLWCWEGGRYALFAWIVWRARASGRGASWIAPFAWAGVEAVYPLVLPSQLGASLHAVPALVQLASLGGTTLVSMLIVLVNTACASIAIRWRDGRPVPRAWMAIAVAALGAAWLHGRARVEAIDARTAVAPRLRVGVVQANLGPEDKGVLDGAGLRRHLDLSRRLEQGAGLDLLVWPETVVPGPLDADARSVDLAAHAEEPEPGVIAMRPALATPVLFGALTLRTRGARPGVYNSALLTDEHGVVLGRYDKRRLLPWGEAMPWSDRFPALRALAPNASRLRAGSTNAPLQLGTVRLSVFICYEDVLPELVRESVRGGRPRLLVNLTNDAWFGDTTEPWIHLALAKLRAIETGRTMVRATNSGVSAVLDPAGRVIARAPPFRATAFVVDAPLFDEVTPFVRLGDWPGGLGLLGIAWCVLAPVAMRRGTVSRPSR